MENRKTRWEPIIYRPQLPNGWECIEQRGSVTSCQTSFIRWGTVHHKAEPKTFWVLFNEFDKERMENSTLPLYSVSGGRDIPGGKLKKFNNLKDAESYMFYLMHETDKMLEELNSSKTIAAYNKKIKDTIKHLEKSENERTSRNSFI